MVILKKIMQNKKEADPDGAEGWDRKKKVSGSMRDALITVQQNKENKKNN